MKRGRNEFSVLILAILISIIIGIISGYNAGGTPQEMFLRMIFKTIIYVTIVDILWLIFVFIIEIIIHNDDDDLIP